MTPFSNLATFEEPSLWRVKWDTLKGPMERIISSHSSEQAKAFIEQYGGVVTSVEREPYPPTIGVVVG